MLNLNKVEEWISQTDACRYLKVTQKVLEYYVKKSDADNLLIPFKKEKGKEAMFLKSDLDKFIKSGLKLPDIPNNESKKLF